MKCQDPELLKELKALMLRKRQRTTSHAYRVLRRYSVLHTPRSMLGLYEVGVAICNHPLVGNTRENAFLRVIKINICDIEFNLISLSILVVLVALFIG